MVFGLIVYFKDADQKDEEEEEEEEQVFIATAKGRNGRKSPYTQVHATKENHFQSNVVDIE